MRYFISDLHNYDPNIIMYEHQNFEDIEEKRSTIVKNWNAVVNTNDIVYLLGDIGNPEILTSLKGTIVVVAGNHDNVDALRNMYPYMEISSYPIMVGGYILSHEPITFIPKECPYLNIHGHLHSAAYGNNVVFHYGPMRKDGYSKWSDGNRYFNVSADGLFFTPISETKIGEILGYKDYLEREL